MQLIITALTNIKLFVKSSLVFRTLSLILKIVAIVILKSLFFSKKTPKLAFGTVVGIAGL